MIKSLKMKEKDNFFRHSLVLVEVVTKLFILLLKCYLQKQGQFGITLRQFISNNKHIIVHLYEFGRCCLCKTDHLFQCHNHTRVLNKSQMNIMLCVSTSHPGSNTCTGYCCYDINPNVRSKDLDITLSCVLLINCTNMAQVGTAERTAIEYLRKQRNDSFAHATEGRISDGDFEISMKKMERQIFYLANVCGDENEIKQSLKDIRQQPFSADLYQHLRDILQTQNDHHALVIHEVRENKSEILSMMNDLKVRQEAQDVKQQLFNQETQADIGTLIDKFDKVRILIEAQFAKKSNANELEPPKSDLAHLMKSSKKRKQICTREEVICDKIRATDGKSSSSTPSKEPVFTRNEIIDNSVKEITDPRRITNALGDEIRSATCTIDTDNKDLDEDKIQEKMQCKPKQDEKNRFSISCCKQQCIILELKYTPEILSSADNLRLAIRNLLNDFIEAGGIDTSMPGEIKMSFTFHGDLKKDEIGVLRSVFSEPYQSVDEQKTESDCYVADIQEKLDEKDVVVKKIPADKLIPYNLSSENPSDISSDGCDVDSLCNNLQNVEKFLNRNTPCLFDVKSIVNRACQSGNVESVKVLLRAFDTSQINGELTLCAACRTGNINLVKLVIEKLRQTKLTSETKIRFTREDRNFVVDIKLVLNEACKSGNVDMVQLLLENIDYKMFDVQTALFEASKSGNVHIVRVIFQNIDNNMVNAQTALLEACRSGHVEIVELILSSDHISFDKATVMSEARISGHSDIVHLMLAKLSNFMIDAETLIQEARRLGDLNMLNILEDRFQNKMLDAKTSFDLACEFGNEDIVKFLLKTFPHSILDLKTAVYNAMKHHKVNIIKQIVDTVDQGLLQLDEFLNYACEYDYLEGFKMLISKFPFLTKDFKMIMIEACRFESKNIVRFLLEIDNYRRFDLGNELKLALMNRNTQTVEFILQNVDFKNKQVDLDKVLDYALRLNNIELMKRVLNIADHTKLNLIKIMHDAVKHNRECIFELICDKIELSILDFNKSLKNACTSNNDEIVRVILNKADHSMLDIGEAITALCSPSQFREYDDKKEHIIKLFFSEVDPIFLDLDEYLKASCTYGNVHITRLLLQNVDTSAFNLNEFMDIACKCGNIGIVKFLLEKIDHRNLELARFFKEACTIGNIHIVEEMLEKVDRGVLDMRGCVIEVCKTTNISILRVLLDKIDPSTLDKDVKEALESGNKGMKKIASKVFGVLKE